MQRPTIDEAVWLVRSLHQSALKLNAEGKATMYGAKIHNPVAWALYKAWRIADGKEKMEVQE